MAIEKKPVWFVTGCSTVIGRELVTLLIDQGFRVVATARDVATLASLVAGHDNALAVALDGTDAKAIEHAVQQAKTRFGQIDVLVNQSGQYARQF